MVFGGRPGKVTWVILPIAALCLLGYILVSAGAFARDTSAHTSETLLKEGRTALTAGRYEDAIASARRLLSVSDAPDVRARAYRLLIGSVRSRDGYDAAIGMAEKECRSIEKTSPVMYDELKGLRRLLVDLKECRAKYLANISDQKKIIAAYPGTDSAAEAAMRMAGSTRLLGSKVDGIAAYQSLVKDYPLTRAGWKAAQEVALLRGNKSESSQSSNMESTLKDLARESGYDAAVERAWFLASGVQAQPSYSDVLRLEALVSELSKNASAPNKSGESTTAEQVERAAVTTASVEDVAQASALEAVVDNEEETDEATVVEDTESQANQESPAATSGNWSGPAMTGAAPLLGIAPVSAVRGNSFPVLSRASSLTPSPPTPASSAPTTPPASVSSEHSQPYPGPYRWHVLANTVSGTVHEEFVVTIPSGEGNCPCDPSATLTPDCGSVTFVERTGQCPTFTFHYDWNTCGCDYGDHTLHFIATNCGATVTDETRHETVDNRPEWSTPPTGITGAQITEPGSPIYVACRTVVCCIIDDAADTDRKHDPCASPMDSEIADSFSKDDAYTWSCGAGRFLLGDNHGKVVWWMAPNAPFEGAVEVMCTVKDDAEIPQGEKGSRDDPDVTRSFTAIVRNPCPGWSSYDEYIVHSDPVSITIFGMCCTTEGGCIGPHSGSSSGTGGVDDIDFRDGFCSCQYIDYGQADFSCSDYEHEVPKGYRPMWPATATLTRASMVTWIRDNPVKACFSDWGAPCHVTGQCGDFGTELCTE